MIGVGLSLPSRAVLGGGAFSPARLFGSAEPGVWYDPSDVANLSWRRNLLTYSEDFSNAAWTKVNVVASSCRITANAVTGAAYAEFAYASAPSATLTLSYTFPSTSGRHRYVWLADRGIAGVASATFDLDDVSVIGNNVTAAPNISTLADGSVRCSITYTRPAVGTSSPQFALAGASHTSDRPSLTWAGGEFLEASAQLELGSTATEYQRITDVHTEVRERFPKATLFQDTAGRQPVTTAGQSVALMLDKSRGLTLGPELVAAGWTADAGWAQNGQTFTATAAATNTEVEISGLVSANKTYQVEITWSGLTASSSFRFYLFQFVGVFDINFFIDGASGSRTYRLTAPSSGTITALRSLSAGSNGTFTLSIRELPGYHATQATTASRPIYAVEPTTGRRNLLTYSEQFDNVAWTKVRTTVTANAAVAPDGSMTADILASDGSTGQVRAQQAATVVSGATITVSAYFKQGSGVDWVLITDDIFSATKGVWFNLSTGALGEQKSGYVGAIENAGNSFYRCSVTFAAASSTTTASYALVNDNGIRDFSGDVAKNILIWGAQVEAGSTATAYQRVVSQYDVTEAGVPSRSYLSFDGIDDGMVTSTITPGVDKVAVFAGVRRLADGNHIIAETSINLNNNQGAVYLAALVSPALSYVFVSKGSLPAFGATASASPYAAPRSDVLAGFGDIAGDTSTLRVNGAQVAQSTADQGTGNYLAYPLYIGRRGGTSLPFNGNIYGMIVRFGANLSDSQVIAAERWLNNKTGAY